MTWDDERIARERAICEAATEGPWTVAKLAWEQHLIHDDGGMYIAQVKDEVDFPGRGPGNAVFIAHARAALPEALDEIERLRAALRVANAELRRNYTWAPSMKLNDAIETVERALNGGAP